MAQYKLIVLSDPIEGREDEYNEWYDNHHLGAVLDLEGFTSAQRFRVAEGPNASHKYMAVYDAEAPDARAAMARIEQSVAAGTMHISDALDRKTAVIFYEAITPRLAAKSD